MSPEPAPSTSAQTGTAATGLAAAPGMPLKQKLKLAGIIVAAVVATLVVLFNTEWTSVHLIVVKVGMPKILLLLLMLAIGFLLGTLVATLRRRDKAQAK